ncbi:heavy metal translocating P-type ATPase, partial [Pseudomonas sp. MWU12-2115]
MSDSIHNPRKPDAQQAHADHDHSHAHPPAGKLQPVKAHDHAAHGACCCGAAGPAPSRVTLSETPSAGARLSSFRIEAMDCPTEQTLIQN